MNTSNNTGLWAILQSGNFESLLRRAKVEEKKYEWRKAADHYSQASNFFKEDEINESAELHEKIGFCYFKAAFQANTNAIFKKTLKLAIQAYEKTIFLFQNTTSELGIAKRNNSKAMIAYVNSWFEFDPSKKRVFLNKWWKLKSKVLKDYEKIDNQFAIAKTCNDMLEGSADCRYWLGTNWKDSMKIRDELISIGERSIEILKEINDNYELARAYCWTSWYCLASNTSIIIEERKELTQKGLNYSKKALEIAQKTGDSWLIGWSDNSASLAADKENDLNSTISFLNQQIVQGEIAKDNYLLSLGRFWLIIYNLLSGWIEEDPDKIREIYKHNLQIGKEVLRHFKIINLRTWNAYYPITLAFQMLASIELDIKTKHSLLTKAVENARKGMELIEGWMHSAVPVVIRSYVSTLHGLSKIETKSVVKRIILEEVLDNIEKIIKVLKAFPFNYNEKTTIHYFLTLAKADLSKITLERKKKIDLLKDAVKSMETCIKFVKRNLRKSPQEWVLKVYGAYYYSFGGIYYQYYSLTKNKSVLCKAMEAYQEAIFIFSGLKLWTQLAESNWQKAKLLDQLGEPSEASKFYDSASEAYSRAAQKIPQLEEFYQVHSLYMLAWSKIERARYNHNREDYFQSMIHYREAASLHEKSKSWNYLSPNYYAWEQLEKGEDLSRKEEPAKATQSFKLAIEYFRKAENSIQKKLDTIESTEEEELATNLIKASDLRLKYCQARVNLEEAKIFDRRGEYASSSKSYRSAAEILGRIIDELESEEEKRELKLIMILSQAWEKMALAEEQASAEVYLDASKLFEEAKTYSSSQKTTLLILGNSSFCKGLAAGVKYQTSLEPTEHARAKGYMKSAATSYLRAGFDSASEYAKGTQRLFDAYLFMNQAESEVDQKKRAKQYELAENLLEIAVGSFMRARQPEKASQVQKILKNVREERFLAVSLNEVLATPPIASTALSFVVPTPTSEVSVGLEQFRHANVQANLLAGIKEVKVGESFCLSIEFVNAGKEPALLTKVEDFVPPDFIVVKKPEIYRLEESCLNMKGKQIAPLKLVEAKLVLQPSKKGIYQLKPTVHYLDELGQNKSLQLKSVEIKVEEVILADRISTGTKELDSLLLGGIPKEYTVVLTGSPSDERDYLIRNFLEAGIRDDEIVFHVTTEADNIEGLLENPNLHLFLCNPKPKVEVPNLPNITKLRSKTDINNLNMALARESRSQQTEQNPKRLCVEIVSDVLLEYGATTTRKWVSELLTDLGSKGFTVLAVLDSSMHPVDQANAIINLFDGEINLVQTGVPPDCKKSLIIKKLRGQDYIKNPICLTKS